MLFNPEESIQFQGNTAPFIQYTHARIAAILRKANQLGINYQAGLSVPNEGFHSVEKELIFMLSDFPAKVHLAAEDYSPALIAQYVYDLAKEYNRFYAELSIFNEEDEATRTLRVAISFIVARTIRKAMGLLGIDVPERM